jgi:hypothetical protein
MGVRVRKIVRYRGALGVQVLEGRGKQSAGRKGTTSCEREESV